ncbi:PREDICTED: probable glycosyltransferase At3g07620 [Tarenaya hassleriana]|uniref:probable glycosyltransferase At3g07620 n=1 Tax=Tarenaya hassleriana TaxID=28532 RepID=UPI00053C56C9|nr:PREDICTED: probable glycosyltransferase At3g07620 [Tarenaya hassleriana]XP_010535965.1 PREDICTED: probable glycosyltransferase At3g07620 [Tarenaya hassleriana]XP_010535966.1 PREDICTED: probable glycosyltransferase At3g07620 [Tarenaya hassleriana]XP_010535967.1 PREDICTED: probable glycosyltransferase At3g07620 [Tarenaya hassleriana]
MEFVSEIQKFLRNGKKKWIFLVGAVAFTHILLFQSLVVPFDKLRLSDETASSENAVLRNRFSVQESDVSAASGLYVLEKTDHVSVFGNDDGQERGNSVVMMGTGSHGNDGESGLNAGVDNDIDDDEGLDDRIDLERFEDENDIVEELADSSKDRIPQGKADKQREEVSMDKYTNQVQKFESSKANLSVQNTKNVKRPTSSVVSIVGNATLTRNLHVLENGSLPISKRVKRKMRCEMPPKTVTTINEMNQILVKHRRSSRAMRPRWSSRRDEEILAAKKEIENAPDASNDRQLYAPIFRNVSMFKRSYELMERILKVYVYKEGSRPIFHTPILKGLYASEGWFMKLMEGNRHYTVKDPRRANLYYMPFSARMLEYKLYVRNSHNRTNLRQYLKEYTEHIASKYPFFNRTGGADHFLVACHDWAPYETRHHMEHCIKALCNADVTAGFKIGRDVSLPETYVRAAKNPLRDLGGKPPSQRRILAFYAGSMHGYLRQILLNHWKDRDPEMKIFGRMPRGFESKMNYIDHMKSSKYCICPKGYEVNSPRVVESIFYECIPVIISDNFVPPFFEVLDWDAFSLVLAEKDIPRLKEILTSIPEEKYLRMQTAVRKAQRHFLWHAKPEKHDLFHMVLHSIWYNRMFQAKRR